MTTVWPPRERLRLAITGCALIVTDRLPCATAQAASVTAWFITTEPVRALMMTFGDGSAGVTSRFSSARQKATRCVLSAGACTRIARPSTAVAVSAPSVRLIASTMRVAVVKSLC